MRHAIWEEREIRETGDCIVGGVGRRAAAAAEVGRRQARALEQQAEWTPARDADSASHARRGWRIWHRWHAHGGHEHALTLQRACALGTKRNRV